MFLSESKVNGNADAWTLESLVAELKAQPFCWVANAGNAGDALIALGTFHFFDRYGLTPTLVRQSELEKIRAFDLIVFGGGGNLIPNYSDGITFLEYAAALGKQIVVLPHTTFGRESELIKLSKNLRIFLREKWSFDDLVACGFPRDRLGLADDLALSIEGRFFSTRARTPSRTVAHCLRMDSESDHAFTPIPLDNYDISATWIGDLWHSRAHTEAVVKTLEAYLNQFETVVTDRLHIAILAGLLGLEVRFFQNSYYKNEAVYQYSLRHKFPNIHFSDTNPEWLRKNAHRSPAQPRNQPSISAIICTHKRYDVLPDAISSLLVQDLPKDQMEIIVVDNSSDEEQYKRCKAEYAGYENFRFIFEPETGLSNARNTGARLAKGDVIAFLDDDAIASSSWLEEIQIAFKAFGHDTGVVGGPVRPIWMGTPPDWLTPKLTELLSIIDWGSSDREVLPHEWLAGCNIAFDRQVLLAVAGFSLSLGRIGSLSLMSNEEMEVVDLIRSRGKKIVYCHTAVVEHQIAEGRLNRKWLKRRIAWQAVSDVMSRPEETSMLAINAARRFKALSSVNRAIYFEKLFNKRNSIDGADRQRIYDTIVTLLCVGD